MNEKTRYVLMVMTSPDGRWAVAITKKKGPSFLINRLCFPGGKIEQDETARAAATREAFEETGLSVPEEAWVALRSVVEDSYELHVFAAAVENVFFARQREYEPVWHLSVPRHLEYAVQQPAQYAHDFLEDLNAALAAIAQLEQTIVA